MPVCVDASVLIDWLVPQQHDPGVYGLVDGWFEDGVEVVGPALLYAEVVSVLRLQAHRGTLEQEDAKRLVQLFLRLGIRRIDHTRLHGRAFELATLYRHALAYDAQYLAAAERERCVLWTADRPLFDSVSHDLPWVKHTSELG